MKPEGDEGAASLARKLERLSHEWGVVPVFTMAGMKIRSREETGLSELQPWFLSINGCVQAYKKAAGIDPNDDDAGQDASLHMATLEELTEAMTRESPIDFRSIIFFPSESVRHLGCDEICVPV
jgi:hypothetical protein